MRRLSLLALTLFAVVGCGNDSTEIKKGVRAVVQYSPGGWGAQRKERDWVERNGVEVIVLEEPGRDSSVSCKITSGDEAGRIVPFAIADLVRVKN